MRIRIMPLLPLALFGPSPSSVCSETGTEVEIEIDPSVCDESKCRNARPSDHGYHCYSEVGKPGNIFEGNITMGVYTCSSEGASYNGTTSTYEGRLISSEPVEMNGTMYQYYTCCPKQYDGPTVQQCWSSVDDVCENTGHEKCWADAPTDPMKCALGLHPRKTGATDEYNSWTYSQYMCCTISNGTPSLNQSLLIAEVFRIILFIVGTCCCSILLFATLSSTKARSHAFNFYVVYLTIPDVIMSICALTLSMSYMQGVPMPCEVNAFLSFFYLTSIFWLNGCITNKIYVLLRDSKAGKRTQPPTIKGVSLQAAAVYLYATLLGSLNVVLGCAHIPVPVDEKGNPYSGYDAIRNGVLFFFMAGPPMINLVYVSFRVWYDKLLPRTGRARFISLYFLRLISCFMFFWVPIVILANFDQVEGQPNGEIIHYANWYLGALQYIVSCLLAMQKPDIKSAVLRFLRGKCNEESTNAGERSDDNVDTRELSSAFYRRSMSIQRSVSTKLSKSLIRFDLSDEDEGESNPRLGGINEVLPQDAHNNRRRSTASLTRDFEGEEGDVEKDVVDGDGGGTPTNDANSQSSLQGNNHTRH